MKELNYSSATYAIYTSMAELVSNTSSQKKPSIQLQIRCVKTNLVCFFIQMRYFLAS